MARKAKTVTVETVKPIVQFTPEQAAARKQIMADMILKKIYASDYYTETLNKFIKGCQANVSYALNWNAKYVVMSQARHEQVEMFTSMLADAATDSEATFDTVHKVVIHWCKRLHGQIMDRAKYGHDSDLISNALQGWVTEAIATLWESVEGWQDELDESFAYYDSHVTESENENV
jgi:hypothetical protein